MALLPDGVVTVTSTVAGSAAEGAMATIVVGDVIAIEADATDPNFTCVAAVKFVPVTVTDTLPERGPSVGEMELTVGARS